MWTDRVNRQSACGAKISRLITRNDLTGWSQMNDYSNLPFISTPDSSKTVRKKIRLEVQKIAENIVCGLIFSLSGLFYFYQNTLYWLVLNHGKFASSIIRHLFGS